MFIPYQAKIKITRIPWMTIAVSILCLLIYWGQSVNEQRIVAYAETFCGADVAKDIEYAQRHYLHSALTCGEVLGHIYFYSHADAGEHLAWHLEVIREQGDEARALHLEESYRLFTDRAPTYLTAGLWKWRGNWNPLRMLSGVFSHGSWDHVIGNLFFFVAFAMVVETVIGPVLFMLVFLMMALGISTIDSLAHIGVETGPTLGLSGVVMGMIALSAWFSPRIKIKIFYFFFLYIGVLSIPIWMLAVWYIGWDVLNNLFARDWSNTNYTAHLAGAAMGLGLGITLFRRKRHWVAEQLVPDELKLTEDEPWLAKLNAISTVPVVMYLVGMGFLITLSLLIKFITVFAVQLLLVAPAVAAAIQIHRMKKEERPDWSRFSDAMAAHDKMNYVQAADMLEDLADKGYPRAQYQLALLYAGGKGVIRDEATAVLWLERAAERGHAQAQYALGGHYADGRGVARSASRAIEWYKQAAQMGLAEAAMSLGYLHEHHPDKMARDLGQAARAYVLAAQLYLKQGNKADAQAAIICLEAIDPAHEGLEKIKGLLR